MENFLARPEVIVWWTAVGLIFFLLAMRTWLILRKEKIVNSQDYFILSTAILLLITAALATRMYAILQKVNVRAQKFGLKSKDQDVLLIFFTIKDAEDMLKIGWIGYIMNVITLWSTKATLLSLYITLLSRVPRVLRIFIITGAVYFIFTFLFTFFIHLFWCGVPLKVNWAIDPKNFGHTVCQTYARAPSYYTYTIFSVTIDIMLMVQGIMTVRLLRKVHVQEKAAMLFIILVGSVSLIATCIKCGILSIYLNNTVLSLHQLERYTVWVSVETLTAVVACTLPTLRGLVAVIPKPHLRVKHFIISNPINSHSHSHEPRPDSYSSSQPAKTPEQRRETMVEMDSFPATQRLSISHPRVYYPPGRSPDRLESPVFGIYSGASSMSSGGATITTTMSDPYRGR